MRQTLLLYTDLLVGYLVTALVGAVAILFLLPTEEYQPFLVYMLMFMWVMACDIFFTVRSRRRVQGLNKLRDDCRIAEFTKEYERFYNRPLLGKSDRNLIRINLATAYFEGGRFDEAMNMLGTVDVDFSPRPYGKFVEACYLNDLILGFIQLNEFSRAENALRDMYLIIEETDFQEVHRKVLERSYNSKRTMLRMKQGDYNGAGRFMRNYFDSASTNLTKVFSAYMMADICHHDGFPEEEQGWLRYAAENGGDSCYADRAKRILSRMTQPAPQETPA